MIRNNRINFIRKQFPATCIFLILLCAAHSGYSQTKADVRKPEKIKGKVYARVNFFTYGVGLGPKTDDFIYQLEPENKTDAGKLQLIRVFYEFYEMKDRLPKSFFDFSKEYELPLTRNPDCDEAPVKFGYQGIGIENEKESILRLMPGADKSLLREDQIMPCYTLESSDFVPPSK